MATAVITETSFKLALAECADAILAADWSTANKKYAVAEAINAGLPVQAGASNASVRRRESLSGLKAALGVARAAVSSTADETRLIKTQTRHAR